MASPDGFAIQCTSGRGASSLPNYRRAVVVTERVQKSHSMCLKDSVPKHILSGTSYQRRRLPLEAGAVGEVVPWPRRVGILT